MFTDRAKRVARMIVHIFETSTPQGDPSAVAVLNDGAGISYGLNQATQRSGSLYAVVSQYVRNFPSAPQANLLSPYLPSLEGTGTSSIARCSGDTKLKELLRLAGAAPEMRLTQEDVFNKKYLQPAIDTCDGSQFTLPLSLAVIYDSMNHGSFELIRDRVILTRGSMATLDFEKAWMSRYVLARDHWLSSIPRLKPTEYRTNFFVTQIRAGNWNLAAPMIVHGFTLTDAIIG